MAETLLVTEAANAANNNNMNGCGGLGITSSIDPNNLNSTANNNNAINANTATATAALMKKFKGEKIGCGELRKYLYSFEIYRQASMLRKGREVHKIYVDVRKGVNFLDDRFALTEFGKMVLDNGSVRAGRARNVRQIVVARETLYCSGTGGCKRACGGYGSCVSGCDKIKVRGHKCSFRVKLTMRLGFVDSWFVEILGSHNYYMDDGTPSDLVSMISDYDVKNSDGEDSLHSLRSSPGSLVAAAATTADALNNNAILPPHVMASSSHSAIAAAAAAAAFHSAASVIPRSHGALTTSSSSPSAAHMMLAASAPAAHCPLNVPVFPESYLMTMARHAAVNAGMTNGTGGSISNGGVVGRGSHHSHLLHPHLLHHHSQQHHHQQLQQQGGVGGGKNSASSMGLMALKRENPSAAAATAAAMAALHPDLLNGSGFIHPRYAGLLSGVSSGGSNPAAVSLQLQHQPLALSPQMMREGLTSPSTTPASRRSPTPDPSVGDAMDLSTSSSISSVKVKEEEMEEEEAAEDLTLCLPFSTRKRSSSPILNHSEVNGRSPSPSPLKRPVRATSVNGIIARNSDDDDVPKTTSITPPASISEMRRLTSSTSKTKSATHSFFNHIPSSLLSSSSSSSSFLSPPSHALLSPQFQSAGRVRKTASSRKLSPHLATSSYCAKFVAAAESLSNGHCDVDDYHLDVDGGRMECSGKGSPEPGEVSNGSDNDPSGGQSEGDIDKELIDRVKQLEAHVTQLRNIIVKKEGKKTEGTRRKKQREFDFTKYNTRHVALKVAYLGWDYSGFVVQEDTDKTIEAAIFDALLKTRLIESRETSNYHRCGRTDKGVSALGQVMSLDLRTNLLTGVGVKAREGGSAESREGDKTTEIPYVRILNKVLPPEIRVLAWAPVETDFSARFSCKKRTYKYYFPKGNLNIELMRQATQKLIGEHDFRNLCKMDVGNGVVNFTRKILKAAVEIISDVDKDYSMCELTVVGQAFLWHQIRCIVSVLFLVAQGKEDASIIDELLDVEKNPRKPQYSMASELPLCLYDCDFGDNLEWIYEADWHEENIRHLQQTWSHYTIKATMIKRMIDRLEVAKVETESDIAPWNELSPPLLHHSDWLIPGNKPHIYRPLFKRQFCESLEERVEHFAKRKKMAATASSDAADQDQNEANS